MIPNPADKVCRACLSDPDRPSHKCWFAKKYMCPKYQAAIANAALIDADAVKLIPVETIVSALRANGYSGELRKLSIVRI